MGGGRTSGNSLLGGLSGSRLTFPVMDQCVLVIRTVAPVSNKLISRGWPKCYCAHMALITGAHYVL